MTEHLSLAQLAEMNTDDIQTLTSRVYPAGLYHVRGKAVSGKERESNKENAPPMFIFSFAHEILDFRPTDKKVDPESMINRDLRESYTIWPADILEGIGLLKGRYTKAGIQCTGLPMGGVEGQEPGWLDLMVNADYWVKVSTFTRQDKELGNRFDWLKMADGA
jgi:hypothetical protein